MAEVTETELDKLRSRNEKLREDILSARSQEADNVVNRNREYELLTLQSENARLEGELASAKQAAKVGSSKSGAATLLDVAKEQLENVQAVAAAPTGVVDTNAEDQPKNTTGATTAVEDGVVTTSVDGVTTVVAPGKASDSSTTSTNGGN